jgi:hypothetical protein
MYVLFHVDLDEAQIRLKLQSIKHFRIVELVEMVALVRQLPLILQAQPKVKHDDHSLRARY